ncbi:DUF4126 domain-containing protein [Patulibacter minatonensis]|uniref:DUF4126 domain-containing protein n=1 Tax=Patulibacter minatonensis TaxID=298163 RepID=UPI00047E84DC|nr:DUF4126 domain-containing protein [Patulibacter minatonensis]
MNYLLDLLQGIGVAAAAGVSPFLPLAVAAGAGLLDLGANYDGTSFSFVESPVLLGLAVVLAILALVARKKLESPLAERVLIGLGVVFGAVVTAATVADRSDTWWPGLIAGGLAALVVGVAVQALLRRTRARLEDEQRTLLSVGGALGAAVVALLSVALPPVGIVAVIAGIWLFVGGRRQESTKHAGLRILR